MFVVVCGGCGGGDSGAAVFLLLPRAEVPISASSPSLFLHVFLLSVLSSLSMFFSYLLSLYSSGFFFFIHTAKSLKAKNHIVFSYNKENFKKYVLACILVLITSLLKSREFGQYFKNFKKNILFCFSIRDYKFIRKTYSRYYKGISFDDIEQLGFYLIR